MQDNDRVPPSTPAPDGVEETSDDQRSKSRGFGLGLVYGVALSGLVMWATGRGWFRWAPVPDQFTAFAIVVLTAKVLSIATVLRAERFRRYHCAAVGIATSIPVAFLLLIGLCIANFKL